MNDGQVPPRLAALRMSLTPDAWAALLSDVAETRTHVTNMKSDVLDIKQALGTESNGHGVFGRLRRLEDTQQFKRGIVWALHGIWSLLMLGIGWLGAHLHQIIHVLGQ